MCPVIASVLTNQRCCFDAVSSFFQSYSISVKQCASIIFYFERFFISTGPFHDNKLRRKRTSTTPKRKLIDDHHQDESDRKRHTSSPSRQANQQYRPEYVEKRPFIKPSSMGKCFAFCTICKADFTVSHGGEFDVKRHVASVKHSRNVGLAKNQTSVSKH